MVLVYGSRRLGSAPGLSTRCLLRFPLQASKGGRRAHSLSRQFLFTAIHSLVLEHTSSCKNRKLSDVPLPRIAAQQKAGDGYTDVDELSYCSSTILLFSTLWLVRFETVCTFVHTGVQVDLTTSLTCFTGGRSLLLLSSRAELRAGGIYT
jgi:hypothetical protein